MKHLSKSLLLLLLVLSLAFFSCEKGKDKITDPIEDDPNEENTDWQMILIQDYDEYKNTNYHFTAHWLGDSSEIDPSDAFSMSFDGESYELTNMSIFSFVMIVGEAQLNPGQSYNFSFYRNDERITQMSITTPHPANAKFPASFNPRNATEINWTLSADNQYQIVDLYSSHPDFDDDDEDSYSKVISPSLRSHTIPANSISGHGQGTYYTISLNQLNMFRKGRNVVMTTQYQDKEYGTYSKDAQERAFKRAKKIARSMLK